MSKQASSGKTSSSRVHVRSDEQEEFHKLFMAVYEFKEHLLELSEAGETTSEKMLKVAVLDFTTALVSRLVSFCSSFIVCINRFVQDELHECAERMQVTPDPTWHERYSLISTWPNALSFIPPSFFRRIVNLAPSLVARLEELFALHEAPESNDDSPVGTSRSVAASKETNEEWVPNEAQVSVLAYFLDLLS